MAAILLPWTVFGCAPEREPSREAVLYYLRNASVDGKVQRAWPEGQRYVDRLLKARAVLEGHLDELSAWTVPESLWDPNDPRWRDEHDVVAHYSELEKLLVAGEYDWVIEWSSLAAAIEDVPQSLKLSEGDKNEFIFTVWASLRHDAGSYEDARQSLEKLIRSRVELYKGVARCHESLQGDGPGLHFSDAGCANEIESQYDELDRDLLEARDRFLETAASEMEAISSQLRQTDRRSSEGMYLDYRLTFYRTSAADLLKNLRRQLEEVEPAKGPEGGNGSESSDERFHAARAELLKKRIEALKPRLDAIQQLSDLAKSDRTSGRQSTDK